MSSTTTIHGTATTAPAQPEPAVRCLLAASGSYREQLNITPLEGQDGRFDVRVTSWLESARDPLLACHARYRTTLDRAALARLHQSLGELLDSSAGDTATTG